MKTLCRCAILASLPTSLCFIIACRDFLPFSEEEMFHGEYQQNFIKAFGAIDPNQTWDFSAYASLPKHEDPSTRTVENPDADFTDIFGYYKTQGDMYYDIIDRTKFTDVTGQGFALRIKEGTRFSIYPVYQTAAPSSTLKNYSNGGLKWKLQVNIDNLGDDIASMETYEWSMSTNMLYKANSTTPDEISSYTILSDKNCTPNGVLSKPVVQYTNTGNNNKIMYFNLLITGIINQYYNNYAAKESQQSSLTGHMRIIDIPHPANIPDTYETLFVACEAANLDAEVMYSYRYKSLVFMLVAPKGDMPELTYTHDTGKEKYIIGTELSKRYMIEDLGSTSDFDFNDIVIDVAQQSKMIVETTETQATKTSPVKTTVTMNEQTETIATVSHVCGTRPFEIQVGDYTFGLVNDPTDQERSRKELLKETTEGLPSVVEHIIGWDPNVSATITGWNPSLNNINVKVWPLGKQDAINGSWQVDFPLTGQVPYIMALPISVPWTDEGIKFDDWQQFTSSGK